MTLPEQFVLLLHRPTGSFYATANQTVAAELGELVLRNRVAFEKKKLRVIDPGPTGTPRLDALLATLDKKARRNSKAVDPSPLLQSQGAAFKAHRAGLTDRRLLVHRPTKLLGLFPANRYLPDEQVRATLLGEIRQVARVDRPIDNQLALLCALVHASGLSRPLGFDKPERAILKSISKGEALGDAVIAAAAIGIGAIAAAGAGGDGGGGDGGGGGGGG